MAARRAEKPRHPDEQQTPERHDHRNDLGWTELGYKGQEFIFKSRFLNDIDYMLCTRRDETENIGEWTFQSPIPENLWVRQSVSGGKRWD
jgi:hypothetical protein